VLSVAVQLETPETVNVVVAVSVAKPVNKSLELKYERVAQVPDIEIIIEKQAELTIYY
jgi:hypothetical protein